MKIIRGIQNIKPQHNGCVATIGNFDGVHLGHQQLLQQLMQQSEKLNLPSTVILFEPHPREFFAPDSAPTRLTRLREKLVVFKGLNIQNVLCIHFTRTTHTMFSILMCIHGLSSKSVLLT